MDGVVLWQSRTATEATELSDRSTPIQQGESFFYDDISRESDIL